MKKNKKLEQHVRNCQIEHLRALDAEAQKIRAQLGIAKPGEEIFQYEFGDIDEDIIVEADGYGGASLHHVDGDGDNRYVKESRDFETEQEACDLANKFMEDEIEYEDLWK